MVGGAHPDMERPLSIVIFRCLQFFYMCILKWALVQAASTMNQSDIRGLVLSNGPELAVRFYVKSCAFYDREYRGNATAHIGWDAYSSYRACT